MRWKKVKALQFTGTGTLQKYSEQYLTFASCPHTIYMAMKKAKR